MHTEKEQPPLSKEKPYGFVCFSKTTHAKDVEEILHRLHAEGVRVWYDSGADPVAQQDDRVALRLENCAFFLPLVTENFLSDADCRDALLYAKECEKPVYPILLPGVPLSPGMKMRFSGLQTIVMDSFPQEELFFQQLLSLPTLRNCMEESFTGEEFPSVSPANNDTPASSCSPEMRQALDSQTETRNAISQQKARRSEPYPGRLAESWRDVLQTDFDGEEVTELAMPDRRVYSFAMLDRISRGTAEYWVVSRRQEELVIFFLFKKPSEPNSTPIYVPFGKSVRYIYRTFMQRHREYTFLDSTTVQPQIQAGKTGKPKHLAQDTVRRRWGDELPDCLRIPDKYAVIDADAFRCFRPGTMISELILPTSILSIGEGAFSSLTVTGRIVLPKNVRDIGNAAFTLGPRAYLECTENSFAYEYACRNHLRNSVDMQHLREQNLCPYCGGTFSFFTGRCRQCGARRSR